MFIYLTLTIISATFLFVTFKFFARFNINNFQGVVFNYWTAALFSFLINFTQNVEHLDEITELLPATLIIGLLFITIFYVTALTTQKLGLAVASVAAKMSMVIPITAGVLLYAEHLGWLRIIGILIALTAVYFTSSRSSSNEKEFQWKDFFLPIILFLGTGMVDASIKFSQHTFMNEENRTIVILCLFGSAGFFGLLKLLFNYATKKETIQMKAVFGGIILGLFNYCSIYFLLKCFEIPGSQSSIVFALLNIGIVLLSSLIALFFFKEKMSSKNFMGIALAIVAIILLTY